MAFWEIDIITSCGDRSISIDDCLSVYIHEKYGFYVDCADGSKKQIPEHSHKELKELKPEIVNDDVIQTHQIQEIEHELKELRVQKEKEAAKQKAKQKLKEILECF